MAFLYTANYYTPRLVEQCIIDIVLYSVSCDYFLSLGGRFWVLLLLCGLVGFC